MDTAPPGAEPAVRAAIAEIAAPVALRRLRIREAAGTPFADVVVAIPSTAALAEGHTTATAVEAAVQRALPGADVVVHVEPSDDDETVTDRVLAAALSVPGIREAHNVTVFDVDGATEVSLHVKVPGGYPLAEGHELAAQVEDAIRASAPEVVAVQTHLEPLDPEVRTRRLPDGDEGGILERVMPVIARIAGADPVALRFLTSDAGIVGFITLELDPAESVARAHAIASEVEDALHRTLPELDELVIHTEPRAAS
jgi:divalent metal cation (Fe/Co/Zn/Cd) transporter